jgi:hypothetical protein
VTQLRGLLPDVVIERLVEVQRRYLREMPPGPDAPG